MNRHGSFNGAGYEAEPGNEFMEPPSHDADDMMDSDDDDDDQPRSRQRGDRAPGSAVKSRRKATQRPVVCTDIGLTGRFHAPSPFPWLPDFSVVASSPYSGSRGTIRSDRPSPSANAASCSRLTSCIS